MSESTTYRTKDLRLAAFLWCQTGVELEKAEEEHGKAGILLFKFNLPFSENEVKQLQTNFFNGKCLVDPRAYDARQNDLRDLIHGNYGITVKRTKPAEK